MNSVLEIEQALRQLPPQERLEIARWLLESLQEGALSHAEGKGSGENGERTPPLPDYSARRRRIFGNKGFAEHGVGCPRGRTLVKTYADTSFLFSLQITVTTHGAEPTH